MMSTSLSKIKSSETKMKGMYDRALYDKKKHGSDHSKIFNPEIVQEFFNNRPSFQYIRDIAVACLEKNMRNQFVFLSLVDKCGYQYMEKLSKNVFSWCYQEFLKRRRLVNCVWLEVFQKYSNVDCLEGFKIKKDLDEIIKLVTNIFNCFYNYRKESDDTNLRTLIYKQLCEIDHYINIFEKLYEERNVNAEKLREIESLYAARHLTKRHTKQQFMLMRIEDILLNAQTFDPIQIRFEINWYNRKIEQIAFKIDSKENNIKQQIDQYAFNLQKESIAGDNVRNTYYTLAELDKHEIDLLQNRFDAELEDIDNKINYTNLRIAKILDKRKLLNAKIKFFNSAIQKRLEKEEQQRQKEETEHLKMEKETAAPALLEKKKNGKKRKQIKLPMQ